MSNKKLYLYVLNQLKLGKNPSRICKDTPGLTKQKLQYYLDKLKKERLIFKVSYGVWNVVERSTTQPKDTQILERVLAECRGHAYIWKVRVPKGVMTKWRVRLTALSIPFRVTGIHKVPMIEINGKKVLLGERHIVIYENASFLGANAIEARKEAIIDLKVLIKGLEAKLNINLYPYLFTVRREHYALMHNHLAKYCNDNKEPIKVRDINGYWLITDNSFKENDLETIGREAFNINLPLQTYWNDHKKHNFKVTPTFVLHAINKNTENLESYAVHLKSHVKSVQELGAGVKQQTKIFEKILKVLEKKE